MYKILTLNSISLAGLERLPRDRYEVASELARPDGVLVRSANMHEMDIPATVRAVGRAGAGVNNIPVNELSARGVPVFNAPGANANAVKELVLAGILLASRNLCSAWSFVQSLKGTDAEISSAVEAGKKRFVGSELPGRTLGILGLGAIGVKVANAAHSLGMNVVGYDPKMTVDRAWQLSSSVKPAHGVEQVLSESDFISIHVPLIEQTRGLINAARLSSMRKNAVLMNFSRAGIVDDDAVVDALEAGSLGAYVCDFPSNRLLACEKVIALPHLGASTIQAEENCAIMVAEQVRDFLENGNITNSVNYPDVQMSRNGGVRVTVMHSNVPNMLGQISTTVASDGINIVDMLNKSRDAVACTMLDVDQAVGESLVTALAAIEGVQCVRVL
jgi:D-3-phosphoglycerate dehydrogenase / 2-oxoglutarate reductase